MNKKQELEIMVFKAKMRAESILNEMALSWTGTEPREIGAPKPYEDTEEPRIREGGNAVN